MRFDEALRILGIEVTAGKKGARRAYLKLIKIHKPDRDPEMFRRVREAYEAVKDQIEFQARFYAPPPAPEPPEPEPEPPASEPPAPEPEPEPEPRDPVIERLMARSPILDAFLEQTAPEIDERPADPPRIETRAEDPPRIETRSKPPLRIDPVDERIDLDVHDAPRVRIEPLSGPPAPEPPASEPPAAQRRRPVTPPPTPPVSPARLLDAAVALLGDGNGKGADQLALQAFEVALRFPEADPPSAYDAIQLTLRLFASGRIVAARRVGRALRHWLSATGIERSFMGGRLAASLAVIQAFLDLPPDTPPKPVSLIAQATVDGHLEAAHPPLRSFARDSPYSAVVAADLFRAHAPLLDGLFGDRLRSGKDVVAEMSLGLDRLRVEAPPKRRSWGWPILVGAVVLFAVAGLGRGCIGANPRANISRFTPPRIELPKIRKFQPISIPSLSPLSLELNQRPAWHVLVCREAGSVPCRVGDSLLAAIEQDDCAQARVHLGSLQDAAGQDVSVRAAANVARTRVDALCRRTSRPSMPSSDADEPPWLGAICSDADAPPCTQARILHRALEADNCSLATAAHRSLRLLFAGDRRLKRPVAAAGRAVQAQCPEE